MLVRVWLGKRWCVKTLTQHDTLVPKLLADYPMLIFDQSYLGVYCKSKTKADKENKTERVPTNGSIKYCIKTEYSLQGSTLCQCPIDFVPHSLLAPFEVTAMSDQ